MSEIVWNEERWQKGERDAEYFEELFKRYNINYDRRKLNQYQIHTEHLTFCPKDIELFNEIYEHCYNSFMKKIIRTPSGGLKIANFINHNAYDVVSNKAGARLTILLEWGYRIAFTIGRELDKTKEIAPYKAWNIFTEELNKDGIDIDDYAITKEQGIEEKELIEKPLIDMEDKYIDQELDNVHHIDYHNSYPAGLCNTHPEFKPTISRLYKQRNVNPVNKAILNFSIGCMQSPKSPWNAKWAHLAKDAINDNNKRIDYLHIMLVSTGREVIGHNTDGIWYRGDIYHGPGEGSDLGEWQNDHINCRFRAKSNGAYEYIDDKGKYTPVVRGLTNLDVIKPRDDWEWGDIYTSPILKYKFEEGKGIIEC